MKKVQDFYYHKAKAENYAARSVYKLQEIDQKKKLFRKGNQVLDLGCAPGSWSQYISTKVGGGGRVFGVDLNETEWTGKNFSFFQGDVFDRDIFTRSEFPEKFDAIVSDMAPKTTGIKFADAENSKNLCEKALNLAFDLLKPEGVFLVKIFQGSAFRDYTEQVRDGFQKVEIIKPKAVRSESKEIYVYGSKLKPR